MGKMSELELQVKELRSCAETIIGIAETLTEIFSSNAADEAPPEKPKKAVPPKEEKQPDFTEVRHRMTLVAQAGHSEEIKALITKYGARKLSEVDPARYVELLKEAEALGNPGAGTDG